MNIRPVTLAASDAVLLSACRCGSAVTASTPPQQITSPTMATPAYGQWEILEQRVICIRIPLAVERMLLLGKERNYNGFWRSDSALLLVKAGRLSDAQNEFKKALRETMVIETAAVSELSLKINRQLAPFK